MRKMYDDRILAKKGVVEDPKETAKTFLNKLYNANYPMKRYKLGSSRTTDKKIKKSLITLLQLNIFRQCTEGQKYDNRIDLTKSIDLHDSNRGAAYYFLCFNVLSRNNASLEDLWTCHGYGNHNDQLPGGERKLYIPEIYQPLRKFLGNRIEIEESSNRTFKYIKIFSAVNSRAYLKFQSSLLVSEIENIRIQDIRNSNACQEIIKKFYDAYYDYGLNKDFDSVIDALLTKLEEFKPVAYDFGPVDHFIQQREIFNTCEQLKHAGKEQEALALKALNIPSLSYHTFNLDNAGDFATQQRRIAYTKILQEKASTSDPMIDSASEEIGMMGPVGNMEEALAMQKHAASEVSVAEPMLKFDSQVSFISSKHEQDNGLEQLTTTESIKAQVKENMSAEKSRDYAATEEKQIAEDGRKISRNSFFDMQDTEYHPNTPNNSGLGGLSIK